MFLYQLFTNVTLSLVFVFCLKDTNIDIGLSIFSCTQLTKEKFYDLNRIPSNPQKTIPIFSSIALISPMRTREEPSRLFQLPIAKQIQSTQGFVYNNQFGFPLCL